MNEKQEKFKQIAEKSGLVLEYNKTYRSWFLTDPQSPGFQIWRYYEWDGLTEERFTNEVDRIFESRELYPEPERPTHAERMLDYELAKRRRHSPITGHFRS